MSRDSERISSAFVRDTSAQEVYALDLDLTLKLRLSQRGKSMSDFERYGDFSSIEPVDYAGCHAPNNFPVVVHHDGHYFLRAIPSVRSTKRTSGRYG